MRFSVAAVLLAFFACAGDGAYAAVCEVPAQVLCPGCAKDIRIRITRSGLCQVTFTPGTGEASGRPVRIEISHPEQTRAQRRQRPRFVRHRRSMPEQAAQIGASGSRCFMFNGRRYCE